MCIFYVNSYYFLSFLFHSFVRGVEKNFSVCVLVPMRCTLFMNLLLIKRVTFKPKTFNLKKLKISSWTIFLSSFSLYYFFTLLILTYVLYFCVFLFPSFTSISSCTVSPNFRLHVSNIIS